MELLSYGIIAPFTARFREYQHCDITMLERLIKSRDPFSMYLEDADTVTTILKNILLKKNVEIRINHKDDLIVFMAFIEGFGDEFLDMSPRGTCLITKLCI